MFPAGSAGAALLVLRLSVAATLIASATEGPDLATRAWIPVALSLLALSLCLGLLTPYSSVLGCVFQLYLWRTVGVRDEFLLVLSIVEAAILAVLGPGAYSMDARIFGRKLLTFPTRR
jgi:hypothetical protein